jgi:L-threonylcarbamoyladenylate synthase
MNIVKLTPENRAEVALEAAWVWEAGGIVIYPTETCYGVGVDGTNAEAVEKLLKYKNRPAGKPISVAVAEKDQVFELIERNSQAENIVEKFLPGPITLVGKSVGEVDGRLESEIGTLGVRLPAYPALLEILKEYGRPVTSTSANLSGGARPYNLEKDLYPALSDGKREMIDLVIDVGVLDENPPSLVIDTTQDNKVFREGLLTPEDLTEGEVYETNDEGETIELGRKIVSDVSKLNLKNGVVFLLQGELGAGKTQFSKGVAAGLGIKKQISSPSFNIVKEYDYELGSVKGKFYHLDLWRVEGEISLEELGIELGEGQSDVLAVEWSDKIADDLDDLIKRGAIYSVKILKQGGDSRRFIVRRLS